MRLPQLWKAFALGWLVVFGIVSVLLPSSVTPLPRLAAAYAALLLLAGLYLHLTLRRPFESLVVRRFISLGAMLGAVVSLSWLVPHTGMWWLTQHVVVAAGLALAPRAAAAAIGGAVAISLGLAWLDSGRVQAILLIQLCFGAAASVVRQLTLTVAELNAARAQVARLAVAEERKRFGRDLHDLLGHSLSAIVLKSELAGRLLASAPQRASREIDEIERMARDALHRVRETVAGYHQPTLDSELAAAAELLAAAGIRVELDSRVSEIPSTIDGLLAWTVREGVTNVIRHSRARACTIALGFDGEAIRLEIRDDGRGPTTGGPTGIGLSSLTERAAAVGGKLRAGPAATGGFSLCLDVPNLELAS